MSSSNIISCEKHKKRVNEDAKTKPNVAAGNNELERNRQPRQTEKFRMLSDICMDPASELPAHLRTANPKNVSVTEDDDDVTLGVYKRKQEGTEVTDSTLKKKQKNITEATKELVDSEREALMLLASHFNIQGNESMMKSSSATRLEDSFCSVQRRSLTATVMTHEAGTSLPQLPANPSMPTRTKKM